MEVLLEKTTDTPLIHFAPGLLVIEGRSITEDILGFWNPLLAWTAQYIKEPEKHTLVEIGLEYINSSSSKFINEILQMLASVKDKGMVLEVNWNYEEDDESILQLGRDLESLCGTKFNFKEIDTVRERARKLTIRRKKTGEEYTITGRYWESVVRNGHSEEYEVIEKKEDN
ncbi:MAG TPA: DUF1987 domain-containing protein [Williamwhitmania sp.]|nr:DUF1987 domain-containing protein [Williamwhitmania sp.]